MNKNTLAIGIFLIILGTIGLVGTIGRFILIQELWKEITSVYDAIYYTYWTNIPIAIILTGIYIIQTNRKDRKEQLKSKDIENPPEGEKEK